MKSSTYRKKKGSWKGKDAIHFVSKSSMAISAAMGERGEPMGKSDFYLYEVFWKLNEELDKQILSPFLNWYQGIFACGWIFGHLSLMPLIAMPIWTLVNSDSGSHEMILWFGIRHTGNFFKFLPFVFFIEINSHWWEFQSESKRLKVWNFELHFFWTLNSTKNINNI